MKKIYCTELNLSGKNSVRNDEKEIQYQALILRLQIKELHSVF
jgi:hypothetical protein